MIMGMILAQMIKLAFIRSVEVEICLLIQNMSHFDHQQKKDYLDGLQNIILMNYIQ